MLLGLGLFLPASMILGSLRTTLLLQRWGIYPILLLLMGLVKQLRYKRKLLFMVLNHLICIQAKGIVAMILNSIQMGFKQVFIYELWDEADQLANEAYFGLFRANQTTKPSGKALRFLSNLLYDTSGLTTSLSFTLSNFPIGGQSLLFQVPSNLPITLLLKFTQIYPE
jgi:hypothetical protein